MQDSQNDTFSNFYFRKLPAQDLSKDVRTVSGTMYPTNGDICARLVLLSDSNEKKRAIQSPFSFLLLLLLHVFAQIKAGCFTFNPLQLSYGTHIILHEGIRNRSRVQTMLNDKAEASKYILYEI